MNIKIPAGKNRIPVPLFIGLAVSFILFFAIKRNEGVPWYYYLPAYIMLFIYAVLFTILSFLDFLKPLVDKNAGLIISDAELYDNISIYSGGKIPWSDISNVEIITLKNYQFLIITLPDNEKYLARKNYIIRYILKSYIKKWGSPVVISNKRINYDLQELKKIILTHINPQL
jgi:hypothetical protein